jgi:K+-transporting ATPase ATPase C chain
MNLRASLRPAIMMMVVFTVLLGLVYPLATTGLAQVLFNDKADGSLIETNGTVTGSSLIGQSFINADTNQVIPGYFRGRPSASNYDAMASGGSNYGPTNPDLVARVNELVGIIRTENGLDANALIPVDLVTASGSGLDPAISPASASIQIERVAHERGISVDQVSELVDQATSGKTLGFLGADRVDVLKLNQLLDERFPMAGV